jgi:hypothetical protein
LGVYFYKAFMWRFRKGLKIMLDHKNYNFLFNGFCQKFTHLFETRNKLMAELLSATSTLWSLWAQTGAQPLLISI